jgi:hypothetical protein
METTVDWDAGSWKKRRRHAVMRGIIVVPVVSACLCRGFRARVICAQQAALRISVDRNTPRNAVFCSPGAKAYKRVEPPSSLDIQQALRLPLGFPKRCNECNMS